MTTTTRSTFQTPGMSVLIAGALLAASLASAETPIAKRGEYLVRSFGCGDCHTPLTMGANGPEPDMAHQLSGHPANLKVTPVTTMPKGNWGWLGAASNTAFQGPWGVSYAINLTPDQETGLGKWTESQFVAALKTGKHVGASRPILPPMPWQALSNMTEADLKAMFAYLRSIPPVSNRVPAPIAPSSPSAQVAER